MPRSCPPTARALSLAFAWLLPALLGCYNVDRPLQHYCKFDPTCPSGQVCRDGVCVVTARAGDGAVDQSRVDAGPDGSQPDQSPADAAQDAIAADQTQPDDSAFEAHDASVPPADSGANLLLADDFNNNKLEPATWEYWRVAFNETNQRLNAVGPGRDGFFYGHSGGGRGAAVLTHIGDQNWDNYRVEVEFEATGVDPSFNPHGLQACYKFFSVLFRVQEATESWNTPQNTHYSLGVFTGDCYGDQVGDWSLRRVSGYYIEGVGYSLKGTKGTSEPVFPAEGRAHSPLIVDGPNKLAVEVRGTNIKIFIRNAASGAMELVAEVEDTSSDAPAYGGVGFQWGWEGLGWIDNVRVIGL